MTQEEFCTEAGIARTYYSKIECGAAPLTPKTIRIIHDVFGVNEEWLLTGEGEVFSPVTRKEYIAARLGEIMKDSEDSFRLRFIEAFVGLDKTQLKVLEDFLEAFISPESKKDE